MKKFFMKRDRLDWIIYAIIFVSVVLFWTPYIAKLFPYGYETGFHYVRIVTLADSLKEGIFPAKIRPTHMKTYGYGIGFFYPDLFIYLPAALVALGLDYEIVVKTYIFLFVLIAAYITYGCFRRITNSRILATVGVILIIESKINDYNFFVGGGLPHLLAYLYLPLAFVGLLRALKDEKSGYYEYIFGIVVVLLTHNLIFVMMMFVMIIIFMMHIGQVFKKPMVYSKLLWISLVGAVVSTAYWLPAFEQVSHIKFTVFNSNPYTVSDHITSFHDLVFKHVQPFYMCILAVAIIGYFVLFVKKHKMPMDVTSLLVINVFLTYFMCSKTFWNSKLGDMLNFFEYTDRFVFIYTVTLVLFTILVLREALEGIDLEKVFEEKGKNTALTIAFLILILVSRMIVRPDFYNIYAAERANYTPQMIIDDYNVSGAEWLPAEMQAYNCLTPNTSYDNEGGSAEGFKHENAKYYEVWVLLDKEYYDVPYVYYYGYKAYLLDDAGNPVKELTVGEAYDDNGYVRVFMPEGGEGVGHIMVTYRKTKIQKISYVISFVSVVAILVATFIKKKKPLGNKG